MGDKIKLPVLLFFEDTLNIIPKNAMWIYLWQDERVVSLANMDNPLPVSQMYQTMRFPYSNGMDDAIKTFTDLGYKIWDNPAAAGVPVYIGCSVHDGA